MGWILIALLCFAFAAWNVVLYRICEASAGSPDYVLFGCLFVACFSAVGGLVMFLAGVATLTEWLAMPWW